METAVAYIRTDQAGFTSADLTTRAIHNLQTRGRQVPAPPLARPITVIIPIAEKAMESKELVHTLEKALPTPLKGLNFLFFLQTTELSDAPPFLDEAFFTRPDTFAFRRAVKGGFGLHLNAALSLAPAGSDILFVNRSAQFTGDLFRLLQKDAYSDPTTGSVTPLSNSAGCASLIHFPNGGALPHFLEPAHLAKTMMMLNLPSDQTPCPEASNVCLYLRRDALEATGRFQEGIEDEKRTLEDWVSRAAKLGFQNRVSSRAFICHSAPSAPHRSSTHEMQEPIPEAEEYAQKDPLKFHRVAILLQAVKDLNPASLTLVTYNDSTHFSHSRDVKRHIATLKSGLVSDGHCVLELFPLTASKFKLIGTCRTEIFLEESMHSSSLPRLIQFLGHWVDFLHVHQTAGWPPAALQALQQFRPRWKTVTPHDFGFLCPSGNLMRLDEKTGSFCGVDADTDRCNSCLRSFHHGTKENTEVYRLRSKAFLDSFDSILLPSDSLKTYFNRALPFATEELRKKTSVLSYDLSEVFAAATEAGGAAACSVAFIGHFGPDEGARALVEAIPALQALGLEVRIFGSVFPADHPHLETVSIRDPSNLKDLAGELSRLNPILVAFPSAWAETFSYAFFEGLILARNSVPVVGPFGNPAELVSSSGIGVVMQGTAASHLVAACREAMAGYSTLVGRKEFFLEKVKARNASVRSKYLELRGHASHPLPSIPVSDFVDTLKECESLATAAELQERAIMAIKQQRDHFLHERNEALKTCEKLEADRKSAIIAMEHYQTECERLRVARDHFENVCQELTAARDHFRLECERLDSARNHLLEECQALTRARDHFRKECDHLTAARNHFLEECLRLNTSREQLRFEYNALRRRIDGKSPPEGALDENPTEVSLLKGLRDLFFS